MPPALAFDTPKIKHANNYGVVSGNCDFAFVCGHVLERHTDSMLAMRSALAFDILNIKHANNYRGISGVIGPPVACGCPLEPRTNSTCATPSAVVFDIPNITNANNRLLAPVATGLASVCICLI